MRFWMSVASLTIAVSPPWGSWLAILNEPLAFTFCLMCAPV